MSQPQNPFSEPAGLPPSEGELLQYLEGKATPDDARRIEEWLTDTDFEGDAAEGLLEAGSAVAQQGAARIRQRLKRQLRKRRHIRQQPGTQRWVVLAVLLILLLAALAYAILKLAAAR